MSKIFEGHVLIDSPGTMRPEGSVSLNGDYLTHAMVSIFPEVSMLLKYAKLLNGKNLVEISDFTGRQFEEQTGYTKSYLGVNKSTLCAVMSVDRTGQNPKFEHKEIAPVASLVDISANADPEVYRLLGFPNTKSLNWGKVEQLITSNIKIGMSEIFDLVRYTELGEEDIDFLVELIANNRNINQKGVMEMSREEVAAYVIEQNKENSSDTEPFIASPIRNYI